MNKKQVTFAQLTDFCTDHRVVEDRFISALCGIEYLLKQKYEGCPMVAYKERLDKIAQLVDKGLMVSVKGATPNLPDPPPPPPPINNKGEK